MDQYGLPNTLGALHDRLNSLIQDNYALRSHVVGLQEILATERDMSLSELDHLMKQTGVSALGAPPAPALAQDFARVEAALIEAADRTQELETAVANRNELLGKAQDTIIQLQEALAAAKAAPAQAQDQGQGRLYTQEEVDSLIQSRLAEVADAHAAELAAVRAEAGAAAEAAAAAAVAEAAAAQAGAGAARQRADDAESARKVMEMRLNELILSGDTYQTRLQALELRCSSLDSELASSKQTCLDQRTSISQLSEAGARAAGEVSRLKESLERYRSRAHESERLVASLTEANRLLSFEIDDRGRTLDELRKALEKTTDTLEVYKKRSHKWMDAYKNLSDDLSQRGIAVPANKN